MPALSAIRSIAVAMTGFLIGLLLAAMAIPIAAAYAETPPPASATSASGIGTPEPGKTISIIVYGDDPCPKGKDDEIVVCARQPESERYRIPKRFRDKKQDTAPNNSWANKVRSTEDASRTAAGIPDTCSSVGTGGQSGCYSQFITQMNQEKLQERQEKQDNPDNIPQN